MPVMGIDPGNNGAAVVVDGGRLVDSVRFDRGSRAVNAFMVEHAASVSLCVLERIVPQPKFRLRTMCVLMFNYGAAAQASALLDCPVDLVLPKAWQKGFGLVLKRPEGLTDGEYTTFKKNKHKAMAIELLSPDPPKIVHAVADAVLLAIYGSRKMGES